jgi:hypothetical protein
MTDAAGHRGPAASVVHRRSHEATDGSGYLTVTTTVWLVDGLTVSLPE